MKLYCKFCIPNIKTYMAEYVFQNVEGMLPELEEMERLELFTKDEIK